MRRSIIAVCLAATVVLCGCGTDPAVQEVIDSIDAIGEVETSDIELIEGALAQYAALTEDQQTRVSNYELLEEAESMLPDLERRYAIENDETPPTFDGVEDGEVIEVLGGTSFNLNEYLSERLAISDDVTEGPIEYRTDCENDAYDSVTGTFDTQRAGEIPVTLVATDEAGNEGRLTLTVGVVPVVVSKGDPTPTIYEGEYGTVAVKSFTHEDYYGQMAYMLVFDVNNTGERDIKVALKSARTSVNGYQARAYYEVHFIPAGIRGEMVAFIYDEDIPSEAGEITTIESAVVIFDADTDEDLLFIPISLEVNVSQ